MAHDALARCRMGAFASPGSPRPRRIAGAAPAFVPSRPHPRALAPAFEPTARVSRRPAVSVRFEASLFRHRCSAKERLMFETEKKVTHETHADQRHAG